MTCALNCQWMCFCSELNEMTEANKSCPFFFPHCSAKGCCFVELSLNTVKTGTLYRGTVVFLAVVAYPTTIVFLLSNGAFLYCRTRFLKRVAVCLFFFFLRTSIGTSPRSLCRSCLQRLFPPLFLALSPGYLLSFPLKHNGKKSVPNACFSQGLNSGTTHHLLPSDRFSPSLNFYVRLRLRIELVGGIRAVGREDPMSFCGPSVFYWEHRCVQPVRAARVCGSVFSLHAVPAQRRQEHPKWKQRVVRRITLSPLFLCATAAEW